jgi:hypothetical protein
MKTTFGSLLIVILIPIQFGFTIDEAPQHNIHFALDSYVLSGSGQAIIRDVYAAIPDNRFVQFGVKGPLSGSLSRYEQNAIIDKRAKSVIDHLYKMGINRSDMKMVNVAATFSNASRNDRTQTWKISVEVFKEPTGTIPVFTSIQDHFPMPPQVFYMNPHKDFSIQGMEGTSIFIAANSLVCKDGSMPGSDARVELKEVYSKADIILAGLHTSSGGRMLETGGTVYLMAYCGDSEMRVANGSKVDIDFPNKTGIRMKPDMKTFNARKASNGQLDWYEAPELGSETTTTERFYINGEAVDRETYYNLIDEFEMEKEAIEARNRTYANAEKLDAYLLSSEKLGWINCDRFYEEENTTNVIVQVDSKLSPALRMVFDEINSVMAGTFISTNKVRFTNVPVGERITIVGYSITNDKAYYGKVPAIVNTQAEYNMKLNPTSKTMLENELYALN